jgi:hypothetical protein
MGFSAEQVAIILESDRYPDAHVYKVVRAYPDGRMEIRGVDRSRFQLEDGLFFVRASLDAAKTDFETLHEAAGRTPPPCRATWYLAKNPGVPITYVTALVFPAEYTDEITAWLNTLGFGGGDEVLGGVSQVTFYRQAAVVLRHEQLWPARQAAQQTVDDALANPMVQAG